MSEALQNSPLLKGIKDIYNNLKFVITNSWIIRKIKNSMFSSHR